MTSINISIKEEAYRFLKSLKTRDRSFSDVILEFKETKGNKERLLSLFDGLNDIETDTNVQEKTMKEFRNSFNRKIEKTIKEMERSRK